MDDDNWILAIAAPDQSEPPRYRWRHRTLDDILSEPRDKQPDWPKALGSEPQIVSVNAAIALARLGEDHPEEVLLDAVRSTELKLPVRRAAAEALSEVHSPAAIAALRELIDKYGQFTGEARSRYAPELHAELLRSLARQETVGNDPRIFAALKSPAPAVKREALEAMSNRPGMSADDIPPLALDLSTDADSQVRIAALRLLAAKKHPQATEKVLRGLADYEMAVRLAAIELLGEIGNDEAHERLKHLAADHAETTRVAAVNALTKLKDRDAVEDAAGDSSWRVRRAVASSLVEHADRRSINLAKQFLGDPSLEVQREAVRSAAKWPVEKAGGLLLAAIESSSYQTRKDAATQLADRWPEAAGFPIDAPAPRRAELLADLQTKWDKQFGNVDQTAIAAAVPNSMGEIPAEVQADIAQKIETLEHGDLTARRLALAALAKQAGASKIVLPEADLKRIANALTAEGDPVMWQHACKLIEQDPREPAALLAATALSHPSSEVRRRACGYFATYPDVAQTESLLVALGDDNISVLHAALQALAEAKPPADVSSVEHLLSHSDHSLHLDAAITLARWNTESGRAALERLSSDDDLQLRRKTAQAIGKLGDAALIPTLIEMLDDQQDIRRAALISLHSITGQKTPTESGSGVKPASYAAASDSDTSLTLSEQAQRWKEWYQRQDSHR